MFYKLGAVGLIALFFVFTQAEGSSGTCRGYGAPCNMTNSSSCCTYPAVLCLPNFFNMPSCLSPLDIFSLSPNLTGSDLISPILDQLQNVTAAFMEVVQINGTTVFNQTVLVTTPTPNRP